MKPRRGPAQARAAGRLEDLQPTEQCTDSEVKNFLAAQGGRLECLVSADGTVFTVEGALNRRVARALAQCVEERVGRAEIVNVTPTELGRWRDRARPRAASEQAVASKEANNTVQYIFGSAIERKASDVYLDIREDHAAVAFRTFGFSRPFEQFSREAGVELATAIWAQGDNAQFEAGRVCDVAFDFEHDGRGYRIRGNSMKEVRGNSVVCRIRDPSFVLPLEESGYASEQVRQIERMCRAPGGLILVTGETNSGKSTTLGSLMAAMPRWQKIIEVADPVEVLMDHVTHVEIQHYGEDAEAKLGESLNALVRQNPDTLVLGEIRDGPTAEAAQRMANQGKRVLSTLHTQSCAAAIPRLVDLGVSAPLLAVRAFLAGIVNQNLVPLVCPQCGLARHKDERIDQWHRSRFGNAIRFVSEEGCARCDRGVSGETLVAEVYPLCLDRTGRPHQLIGAGKLAALEAYMKNRKANHGGYLTKHEHAAEKIKAGLIDPEYTERIIGEFDVGDLARDDSNLVSMRV